MKRNFLNFFISAHFGVGLVLAGIGFAIAGPCYEGQWEMPGNCSPVVQCGGIGGGPTLGCPGVWSITDPAININWPCGWSVADEWVPQDYVTSGNEPQGRMDQGEDTFPCRWNVTCTKQLLFWVPLTYQCVPTSAICEQTTRWTAVGDACPTGT